MLLLYLLFFVSITLLVYAGLMLRSEKKEQVQKRISLFKSNDAVQQTAEELDEAEEKPSLYTRVLSPVIREFKKSFKKRMPGEKEARLERRLLQAGSPFNMTPVDFRIFQLALFFICPMATGIYASLLQAGTGMLVLFVIVGVGIALFLPQYYLTIKIKQRNKRAIRELPDVLDLLTVSLEAGLGFDGALGKLIAKKEGVLATEFQRCLEEIRLGKTRREALGGVKERITADEVSLLISSIIQAERLGIGMVQVLRVQSHEVREQRKQRAEEEAMKAPIKMLFPLVLFIFPSLFIVLLGPAIIQFISTFSGMP